MEDNTNITRKLIERTALTIFVLSLLAGIYITRKNQITKKHC